MSKKCPNCNQPIKYLEFEFKTIQRGIAMIDSMGEFDAPPYETEIIEENYFCPKCNKRLEIEDPEEFLLPTKN